jgi:hypothetical protein
MGAFAPKTKQKDKLNTPTANVGKRCRCLQQLNFGVKQMHREFSIHCKLLNNSAACHSLSVQTKTTALSTNTLLSRLSGNVQRPATTDDCKTRGCNYSF